MKDLAIYGAGGLGREVATTINYINHLHPTWNLIGFFDDGVPKGTQISHYGEVLGDIDDINNYNKPLNIAIAMGNPHLLRSARNRITNPMVSFPNIIFEPFGIADISTFKIGEGNIIQGSCWASCNVTIGNFNILNGLIVIGHDVTIGDYNAIMPDVRISGEVTMGDENLLGVGSIVLQQIKIGNNVHLGPGSVLLTKPKDGNTYIGNPAKKIRF